MIITSKKDLRLFLEADRIALGRKFSLRNFFYVDYIWRWTKLLRTAEYYYNCRHDIFGRMYFCFILRRFRRLSTLLGLDIPLNVFGPGLSIAHGGKIVVNPHVKVGKNCRIHVDVVLGQGAKTIDVPTIGDNVHIGPGVKVLGDVVIGDNIVIAANAVVTKNFSNGNCTIGGVPAKIISRHSSVSPDQCLVILGYELALERS